MNALLTRIDFDPAICFGKPRIKGTRIAVGDILGWLAAGQSAAEIMDDFPELRKTDIRAALAFAAARFSAQSGLRLN